MADQYQNVPVYIFNTGTTNYNVFINETSPTFEVDGTSASVNWVPSQPMQNSNVLTIPLNFTMNVTPGEFNLGSNTLNVAPVGGQLSPSFTVEIPNNVQFTSGQLYLFWNGYVQTPNWAFLNSGEIVASSLNVVTQVVNNFSETAVRNVAEALSD